MTAQHPGGRDDAEYDALFADIVSRWNEPPAAREGSADSAPPASEPRPDPRPDADPRPGGSAGPPAPSGARDDPGAGGEPGPRSGPPRFPSVNDAPAGWRIHVPPPEPEDDTFTPPTPAPLPTGDPTFWGALVGLVVGPIWVVYLVMADPYGPKLPMIAAVVLTIGGFALLVSRLPRRRPPDDDDRDDGAVV